MKTSKVPKFNAKNIRAFASSIYSTKNGKESYRKLCQGELTEGKMHCVLGEMYTTFIGPLPEESTTFTAIYGILDVVPKSVNYDDLAALINANDIFLGEDTYKDRALRVAKAIRNKILPLLK